MPDDLIQKAAVSFHFHTWRSSPFPGLVTTEAARTTCIIVVKSEVLEEDKAQIIKIHMMQYVSL